MFVPPPPPLPFLLPFPFPMISQDDPQVVFPLASTSTSKSNEPFVFTPIRSTNVDFVVENDDVEEEPTITFERIVELAPVDVKTGEEDEEILFCQRAKLYRYDFSTRQYKERGTGPMKILQHRFTGFCRVLMRREQIWKICANHQINDDTTLNRHQEKDSAFIWSAVDFADGVAKDELLCIRFKTAELANEFFKKFNEAKQINQKKKLQQNSENDDEGEKRFFFLFSDRMFRLDLIVIGEIRPTAEQIDRAKRLQLPLTFYLYENKSPCRGCRGCEIDSCRFSFRSKTEKRSDFCRIFSSCRFCNSKSFEKLSFESVDRVFPLKENKIDRFHLDAASVQHNRPIIRAKRTLPTNRVPPTPTLVTINSISTSISSNNVVEQNQGSKKSRYVPSFIQHSASFSLDDFAADLAKCILTLAKNELVKRWNDETTSTIDDEKLLDRISVSSSDSHPGFSFSQFDTTVDTSKPFIFK